MPRTKYFFKYINTTSNHMIQGFGQNKGSTNKNKVIGDKTNMLTLCGCNEKGSKAVFLVIIFPAEIPLLHAHKPTRRKEKNIPEKHTRHR